MRALPCGSCFLRLRMPRSPSRHPLAGAAEQLRRDGTFAIATSSPSPFRAPSRLRCTSPSRVRCAGAARVARRRNSSLHDGSAVFARANRPRARFRCRRASRSTMGAATRPNTHRIASHRIASHRIASHRIERSDACAASFTAGHHPADRPRIARSARCARRASGARGLPERRAAHRNARDSRRNSRRNRLRTTRRRTLPLTPSQAERPFRDARRLKNRVPATRQAPCEVRSASQPQATPAHCRARRSEHGAHHSTIRPVV
ncbi:Uncharacterised protein [Burkholderia pseudomallei]|nr:Uncharacterised protein [Burkholderia pseudomallei]CAJ3793648.1 Uncharacterised protein [Burkholderia pseudomallei]CAJ4007987.1 Uncharacterised protein [Burkholderia pseudomallei]CAJ4780376.1 Uncharacterised protein [Burkholderia pseudomallei]CAJ4845545.1 Uncharacterised protein [Burkholderia pseudomallei]